MIPLRSADLDGLLFAGFGAFRSASGRPPARANLTSISFAGKCSLQILSEIKRGLALKPGPDLPVSVINRKIGARGFEPPTARTPSGGLA